MDDQGIIMNRFFLVIILVGHLGIIADVNAQDASITRLHYDGGGDWYANPSSLPNLIDFITENTDIPIWQQEERVRLSDATLYDHPYLYMTGHGNVKFSNEEVHILRDFLTHGGFLHADDNYGMDESFRREMKKVFPHKSWVELPHNHPIFSNYFSFPKGLPKIHEHDGKKPQALGLFHDDKLVVLYTYECDLGDGWEDLDVHQDGEEKHRQALEMGTNIFLYSLSH